MFAKKPRLLLAPALLLLLAHPAWSIGFSDGWQAAKQNDPAFQAAIADGKSGALNKDIGRAGLLPQISLSSSRAKVNGSNIIGTTRQILDYTSDSKSVQLRQPLFNIQRLVEYQQGAIRTQLSESVLRGKELDLAVRYASAYFNVLFARKTIDLYDARKKSIAERINQTRHLFDSGEGVITDIDDAVTRMDLVNAALVEAEQNLFNSQAALQEIIGEHPSTISGLKTKFTPYPLSITSREDWVNTGLEHSIEINSRKQILELSNKEIKRTQAQHLPTVDFVSSYSKELSASVSTINQDMRTRQLGIQLNFPIFNGGGINAQVEQAVANKERSKAELDMAIVETKNEIEKQYYAYISGNNRILALEKALVSAERAIKSNAMSFKAGVRTNLDVLNAEEQMFQIKKDLLEAKLIYMTSLVKLYATAGILTDAHLKNMDDFFDNVIVLPSKAAS